MNAIESGPGACRAVISIIMITLQSGSLKAKQKRLFWVYLLHCTKG